MTRKLIFDGQIRGKEAIESKVYQVFRRNNNVVSPRGKLQLLIILIGVVPFGKKTNIKLGK